MTSTRRTFVRALSAFGATAAFAPQSLFARSYLDTTWWDPYVKEFTDVDTYLRRKFRQDVTDRTTGLSTEGLRKSLGGELMHLFAAQVNGRPNARGGKFFASGHCALQFVQMGRRTGATPDGRKAGEEMSKNLSPTMGADTEGTTALVMTLANSGATLTDMPGDFPLDVMIHPSACHGARGLAAMKTVVRLAHRSGVSVVQFTVFSEEELRDAQAHPEKYENLQVRVCGWNVRWNDLSKAEQDAYIRRASCIMR